MIYYRVVESSTSDEQLDAPSGIAAFDLLHIPVGIVVEQHEVKPAEQRRN